VKSRRGLRLASTRDRERALVPELVPELIPEPVNPRPHDFLVTSIRVTNLVTGVWRELDPRAWPTYDKPRTS
jgi:hypothetical protein